MQPCDGPDACGCARVRVSDADRENAIDVLKAAFAEGRLTREEHAARVERALGSRTCAELAAVSGDLPAGPLEALPSRAQRDLARALPRPAGRTNPLAVASLACGLIPVLPATLAAIVLGVAARHQIRQTGDRGAGLAVCGLALGALYILLTVVVVFVVVRLARSIALRNLPPPGRRARVRAFVTWDGIGGTLRSGDGRGPVIVPGSGRGAAGSGMVSSSGRRDPPQRPRRPLAQRSAGTLRRTTGACGALADAQRRGRRLPTLAVPG